MKVLIACEFSGTVRRAAMEKAVIRAASAIGSGIQINIEDLA